MLFDKNKKKPLKCEITERRKVSKPERGKKIEIDKEKRNKK